MLSICIFFEGYVVHCCLHFVYFVYKMQMPHKTQSHHHVSQPACVEFGFCIALAFFLIRRNLCDCFISKCSLRFSCFEFYRERKTDGKVRKSRWFFLFGLPGICGLVKGEINFESVHWHIPIQTYAYWGMRNAEKNVSLINKQWSIMRLCSTYIQIYTLTPPKFLPRASAIHRYVIKWAKQAKEDKTQLGGNVLGVSFFFWLIYLHFGRLLRSHRFRNLFLFN